MLKIFYKKQYATPADLYQGLKNEECAAVQRLIEIIAPFATRLGKANGLSHEDIEDVAFVSVMRHIELLREGKYQYRGICPSAFTKAILYYRVRDYWKEKPVVPLDYAADATVPDSHKSLEINDLLKHGMLHLTEDEAFLLRSKYELGYSDNDLVDLELDKKERNTDALKTARRRARIRFMKYLPVVTLILGQLFYRL
jgi:hypothetical protein